MEKKIDKINDKTKMMKMEKGEEEKIQNKMKIMKIEMEQR